jgi:3-oxoacyl-[acyl-carrier protein] reductase
MGRHQGKVAVVTGAARGIGLAIARVLAEQGAKVMLVDTVKAVHDRSKEMLAAGLAAESFECDVAQPEAIRALIDEIVARHNCVDILVNNAGIAPKLTNGLKAPIESIDLNEWQRVLDVNLTSVFLLVKACVPGMKSRKWGRIINLTSVAGRSKSDIAGAAYCASKAGLIGFSRVLANEVGLDGIRVNCIAPGRIMTPLAAIAGEEINQGYIKLIPVGRLGTPEDIARVASFLASDDVDFVTGAVIDVNGGSYMA